MWGHDLEYVDEWTLPLLPESGTGAPTQMVDACFAVGSDLHWRRSGAHLDLDRLRWTLSLHETGVVGLGVNSSGPRRRVKVTSVDERTVGISLYTVALHMDLSLAEATVVIADIVQTELAGYPPWVEWPVEEKRLLWPTVVDGEAVWRDPRTDREIAPIGLLAAREDD
ncbi:hypothetical protein ASG56_07115 [Rhodococcus sp. Leaf7]|uniref:hypothetical protein n=1 Tax=unclassified Rhodococcus (in: high G+C Gram-positive bacteria) TaxID=192944 RepID=UPI0006F6A191|nr:MULTISPECIES: hypothetical protein [unclassified Rhodococcus (in: high G+C Gram-positive bacteria)]KQU07290.1 hypothetical protein ASG56_07115 [Rhodococcus sp. Leaf7]KQU42808.1 hypothetical protein ASG64_07115 [Rhodococcus sp. Leaf247]